MNSVLGGIHKPTTPGSKEKKNYSVCREVCVKEMWRWKHDGGWKLDKQTNLWGTNEVISFIWLLGQTKSFPSLHDAWW